MLNKYYKEKDYAEKMLSLKTVDGGVKNDLRILAKYYKSENKKPKEREELLYAYCKDKGNDWFKDVLHYKMIDSAVNYSRKKESILVQIDSIPITRKEIEFIEHQGLNEIEKKVIFSLLVVDKLKKEKMNTRGELTEKNKDLHYFGGSGQFSYKSILDSLHMNFTRTFRTKGIHIMIKKFNELGLTRTARTSSVELLFISKIDKDDEIAFIVEDFDRMGLHYDLYYRDKKVKKCKECGILIRANSNKKKYCEECFREVEKERQRQKWHKNKYKYRAT